jgi:hypothetical protein
MSRASWCRAGLFLSNGDFYATTIVERLGHARDGVVRAGCALLHDRGGSGPVDRRREALLARRTSAGVT